MADEGTILDLITRVHLEGLNAGLAQASAAVTKTVSDINGQFRSMAVQANAAGDSVTAQAAALRASGLNAADTSSALRNLGFSEAEVSRASDVMAASLSTADASVADFRNAVQASMGQASGAVAKADEEVGESLTRMRGRLILTSGGFRVAASGVSSSMAAMGAAVAATLAYSVVKSLIESELALANFAKSTGLPIEAVGELIEVFKNAGASDKEVMETLQHLGTEARNAAEGSKTASDAFAAYGISVKDWNGVVPDTLNLMARMSDGARLNAGSAALAEAGQTLFGGASAKINAVLEQGSQSLLRNAQAHSALAEKEAADAQVTEDLNKKINTLEESLHRIELGFVNVANSVLNLDAKYTGLLSNVTKASDIFELMGNLGIRSVTGINAAATDLSADSKSMTQSLDDIQKAIEKSNIFKAQSQVPTIVPRKEQMEGQLSEFKKQMDQLQQNIDAEIEAEGADYEKSLEIQRRYYTEAAANPRNLAETRIAAQAQLIKIGKETSEKEYQDAQDSFQQQKAAQEANGTWTVQNTIDYWTKVISTTQFAAAQQIDIQRTINEALHQQGVERFQDQVAFDEETLAATRRGSQEYLDAARAAHSAEISQAGARTEQIIASNKRWLEAQMDADKTAAQDAVASADEQSKAFIAGDQRRLDSIALTIAKLKAMQDNLNRGLTTQGQPVAQGQLDQDPQKSAQLQVAAQKAASDEIGRLIDAETAKWMEAEKEHTAVVEREQNERMRLAEEFADKEAEIQIAGAKAATDETIKQTERIAQYDLISLQQKYDRIKAAMDLQAQASQLAINGATAEAAIQLQLARTEEQRTQVIQRLAQLQEQADRVQEENTQKLINLTDQLYDDQIRKAQQAASVISESFDRAFGTMLTQHTNFKTVMEKFWVDMVLGWSRMGIQILAQYVATLATMLLRTILTELQITTIHTQQVTLRQATDKVWQEFLSLLGIKTVTQQGTTETDQTAAHATGVTARTAATKAGALVEGQQEATAAAATINYAAAAGAAAAFASVIEALPFPANVSTAPGVAAGVLAAIEGFNAGTAASAALNVAAGAKGALIGKDQVMLVHEGESVIPKNYTQQLLSMGHFEGADKAEGASPSILDKIGAKTYETKLPDQISKNITTAFTNTTEAKKSGQPQSVISNSMSKLLNNVSIELASAANGMIVPHDMLAQVHEKETILPAHLSEGFQKLIAGGNTNTSATQFETHHHYSPKISVNVSGKTQGEIEKQIMETVPDAVHRGIRKGKIKLH